MSGLDSTGFTPKTFAEIKASIDTVMKPTLGAGVATDSDSLYANIRNVFALELALAWEAQESIYNQRGINLAEGVQLDNEASVVGVQRVGASFSVVGVDVEGSQSTVIPVGTQLNVSSTGKIFQTTTEHTLPAVGSQPLAITMQAIEKGAIVCLSGELTGTLPIGVTSMTNPLDATVGDAQETDEEFRVAYPTRLARIGGASIPAITAELESVANVTSALLRENVTDIIDTNNLLPHSFQAIVSGGTDEDVAQALFDKKAAGIATNGAESEVIVFNGQNFTLNFDRPTDILIYITVDILTVDSLLFPVNGNVVIEDNILAYGDTLVADNDVLLAKLQQSITSVPGILTYTLKFDTITPPVNQTINIAIDLDEVADFDSTRTIVNIP